MLSQGASKVNISLVVPDERGVEAIKALHERFFEQGAAALAGGESGEGR